MTARARKKPILATPAIPCQVPACPAEYPAIGDYTDTYRAAETGGWLYRIFDEVPPAPGRPPVALGIWLCPEHRDVIPWWPGAPRLALPVRVAGSTRAEFLGVVPAAALPAAEADPLDDATRKLAALHDRQAAGEDVTAEVDQVVRDFHHAIEPDLEPLPPLPQRKPAGPPEPETLTEYVEARFEAAEAGDVAGLTVPHWQAAINAELSEGALAGGVPLESLAPEQEDEADA